jgi:hypothetical protein
VKGKKGYEARKARAKREKTRRTRDRDTWQGELGLLGAFSSLPMTNEKRHQAIDGVFAEAPIFKVGAQDDTDYVRNWDPRKKPQLAHPGKKYRLTSIGPDKAHLTEG